MSQFRLRVTNKGNVPAEVEFQVGKSFHRDTVPANSEAEWSAKLHGGCASTLALFVVLMLLVAVAL
jgi:hypothetical protein